MALDLGRMERVSIGSMGEVQAIACRNVYYWKSSRTLKLVTPDKTYSVLMSAVVRNREQLWNDYGTNVYIVIPYNDCTWNTTLDLRLYFGTKQVFTKQDGSSFEGVGLISDECVRCYYFDEGEPNNPIYVRRDNGNNRWMHSNLRQWLNKSGKNWYTAQHAYDCKREDEPKIGFLSCIPPAIVDAAVPVKMSTKTCNDDGGGYDTTYDRFFILSVSQCNFTCTGNTEWIVKNGLKDESEGRYWGYWRNKLHATGYVVVNELKNEYAKMYMYYEGRENLKDLCWWYIRSAALSSAGDVWCGMTAVRLDISTMHAGYWGGNIRDGVAPACVIG